MKAALAAAGALFQAFSTHAAHADETVLHRGRCQSLTILDHRDAVRCTDEMVVQVGAGQRGFVFRTDHDVVLFVTIDQKADAAGQRVLPVNRVDLAVGSQVETIPVLSGSCRSVEPTATWRAETACDADTTKGRFAAQFVTIDGAADHVRP